MLVFYCCRAFTPLTDQDRIFQNIYGQHDTSIKGAMKYGDWHMTDKIVQKVNTSTLHQSATLAHIPQGTTR